jgi:hypothetical protein
VGFVVDKVALGQGFSEYFGFPCHSSFHQLLHNHHLSSRAGTIGQEWPTYQVDSVSPHPEKLKKENYVTTLFQQMRPCNFGMMTVNDEPEGMRQGAVMIYIWV